MAPSGLYARLCHAFLVKNFLSILSQLSATTVCRDSGQRPGCIACLDRRILTSPDIDAAAAFQSAHSFIYLFVHFATYVGT